MRRYLLDSNAISAFIARSRPFADRLREARARGDRIGTCEPVVAELFYGLEFSSNRDENTIRLRRALSQIKSWPFNRAAAQAFGQIAADLRRRGRTIQIIDTMQGAIALTLTNCVVVSTDGDLRSIPGLTVEDWTAPVAGGAP